MDVWMQIVHGCLNGTSRNTDAPGKKVYLCCCTFFFGWGTQMEARLQPMERSFTLWVLILQITFGEASSERSTGAKPCCWPSHDPCGQRSCREHVACILSIPAQQIETDMFFYSRWIFQIQKEWTEVLHLSGGTPKPMHSDTSKVWRGAWLGRVCSSRKVVGPLKPACCKQVLLCLA